jgi:ATP-dependent DNA ligase
VKNRRRQELVIGSWVDGEGRRRGLPGAVLLGYYDGDRFIYAGKTGTGFNRRRRLKGSSIKERNGSWSSETFWSVRC